MEQKILKLIEEYESQIKSLKIRARDDKEELHALISIAVYKRVIQDLQQIADKSKYENNF